MVKELVESVVSRSVVGKLLEEVVTRSAWRTQINQVWRLLEYDQPLQDIIRKKMERQEAEHRRWSGMTESRKWKSSGRSLPLGGLWGR